MTRPELSGDGATLTVRVPFAIRKRGRRKPVVTPDAAAWAMTRRRVKSVLVKALARAHRWQQMPASGLFGSSRGGAILRHLELVLERLRQSPRGVLMLDRRGDQEVPVHPVQSMLAPPPAPAAGGQRAH